MITLEIIACGKVQVSRQLEKENLRLMSTLRLLRESKAVVKKGRGRPPKNPTLAQQPKLHFTK